MTIEDKKKALEGIISECGSMLVSYSGGVDSTLLAVLAHDILGDRSRSILLDSPLVPRAAITEAKKNAEDLGIAFDIVKSHIWRMIRFRKNSSGTLLSTARKSRQGTLSRQQGNTALPASLTESICLTWGSTVPGSSLQPKKGLFTLLFWRGLTKEEIRQIARDRGLSVWNKPSAACLSSRIPYGDAITLKNSPDD